MWSRSQHSASPGATAALPNRRQHHRHKLRNLAYVKVDSGNGGILLDLGQQGMAMRVVLPLPLEQLVHLRVDLPDPRLHFEAEARVAWIDSAGQTGIEFLALSSRSAGLLKDWLFTQLLADTQRLHGNTTAELLFSDTPRPAIRLDRRTAPRKRLRLLWLPVSPSGFAWLVDGMALLCAVLLFSVLSLTLTDVLPSWPIGAALLFGVSGIFALVYGFLSSVWLGVTPGTRLAELAGRPARRIATREDQDRFR